MTSYLLKRLAQVLVTLLLFHALLFLVLHAQPGNIAEIYVTQQGMRPDDRERIMELYGLDRPLWQQYVAHLQNSLTGDLGVSFTLYPRPVVDVILERLPRTVVLFATATVISFYLGFLMGKLIAWRRGGFTEYAATIGGVTLYTVFTPWFALMMIWLFAVKAGWFPLGQFLDPSLWTDAPVNANYVFGRMLLTAGIVSATALTATLVCRRYRFAPLRRVPWMVAGASLAIALVAWGVSGVGHLALDIVWHMALPVATLALISFAGTMLLTRNSMLDTMREDYVFAARARGLPEKVVRDRYAARNALLPVVTSFVLSLAFAIDGGVLTETVFAWPGMGMTLVEATHSGDIPLALGAFIFTGLFALAAHLVADITYAYLDPRIRY